MSWLCISTTGKLTVTIKPFIGLLIERFHVNHERQDKDVSICFCGSGLSCKCCCKLCTKPDVMLAAAKDCPCSGAVFLHHHQKADTRQEHQNPVTDPADLVEGILSV